MRTLLGLVALLLVLAVGIALGAGPLGDEIDSHIHRDHPKSATTAKGGDADGGSDPVDAALIGALAPGALTGKLTGQTVAVVALPGAASSTLKALSADIVAAGGAVASTTEMTDGLTAVSAKQLVDSLGTQLSTQLAGVVDPTLTTYPRMGALLGAALTTKAAPASPTPAASTIRDSLQTGGLVTAAPAGDLATMTLVLTGDNVDDAVLTGLVSGLLTQTHGLVVAGDTHDGDVAAVRDATLPVGTFDGDETAGGAVGSVLLLVRQLTAPGGAFGASGSDGSVPLG